jgi:hypothetical protein
MRPSDAGSGPKRCRFFFLFCFFFCFCFSHAHVKAKQHVDNTTSSYVSKLLTFIEYVLQFYPQVLVDDFKRRYEALPLKAKKGQESRRSFLHKMHGLVEKSDATTFILKTELITEKIVGEWLAGFKGKHDSTPAKSVFGVAQSALVDLFKKQGSVLSPALYDSIKKITTGANRTRAAEKVEGKVPMEEGKAAIPGHLYLEIVDELMRRTTDVFVWVFLVCSWNLMCRVSNVTELRSAHLNWVGDALMLHLVKHKADQEGERTDPKHCYANPFNPSSCIVTALGVFFAVFGAPSERGAFVFAGDRQHDRFVVAIRRVLEDCPALKAKCDQLGITPDDIASHSIRKGGRSFCQGGTTNSPSTPSILMRGGWALEGALV